MSESYQTIRVERGGLVAEVVLERPGQLNSMDRAFFHEIRRAFEDFQADDSVRAVIIWAEGRAFSTGLNLKESISLLPPRAESDSDASRNHALLATIADFQDCFQRIRNSKKPVIAAINGMCLGGGLDLATACDIRLCSAEAVFAIQETKMAMVADLGTLWGGELRARWHTRADLCRRIAHLRPAW